MTTIAFRDGVMAADTGVSAGSERNGWCRKILMVYHKKKPFVVGASGTMAALTHLERQVSAHGLKAERWADAKVGSADGLIYHRATHTLWYWHDEAPHILCEVQSPYEVIGSGTAVALGAMHAGATAEAAVRAAICHDEGSSGDVIVVK